MIDLSHLEAIQQRINRERDRWARAMTDHEASFRLREIAAAQKELDAEYKFLGVVPLTIDEILTSDDELLTALET